MAQLKNHTYQMEQQQQDTKHREMSDLSSISSGDMTDNETEGRHESSSSELDLSKFASQTPIHEGMVFKIGGKGRLSRIQKRFFILYEGVIIYYHHLTTYKKDRKRGFVSLIKVSNSRIIVTKSALYLYTSLNTMVHAALYMCI